MPVDRPPPARLRGRSSECDSLRGLLREARSGHSAVLVLDGEPGIGKSALVDFIADAATDCRVLRATGVESEMELAFAGVHQLCQPLLDGLDGLPPPQADALGTALGLRSGTPPDRFLVGLAVLTLLAERTADRPLLCLVDDAQWLDRISLQTLTFVARRLAAEPIVMLFAGRRLEDERSWAGLPRLTLGGLKDADAEALLRSTLSTPLDPRVRDRLLAETHGNPLALLQLHRWQTDAELVLGPDDATDETVSGRMEAGFRREVEALPEDTRRLLLIAAAEPLGDVDLLHRAAARVDLGMEVAEPAEVAALLDVRGTVRFRHPLVRTAVYRAAGLHERRAAHRALAAVTDPERDPDRRVWHLAHAAGGLDEAVAAQLEQSAGRALAHGGLAAAAAFLERAAALTPDETDRAERLLNAAQTMVHAGLVDRAVTLVAVAERGPLSELQQARAELLRAEIAFASSRVGDALPLLLAAARRLESLDPERSYDTYVGALEGSIVVGRLAPETVAEVATAARAAPPPRHPDRRHLLVQALAVRNGDGLAAAAPLMRRAVRAYDVDDVPLEEGLRFLVPAGQLAVALWDWEAWASLARRHLALARSSGALTALQFALNSVVHPSIYGGELAAAAAFVDEAEALAGVTGTAAHPYAALALAAFHGDGLELDALVSTATRNAEARGEGLVLAAAHRYGAIRANGSGNHAAALGHCRAFFDVSPEGRLEIRPYESQPAGWALAELVEAAVRCDEPVLAQDGAALLTRMAEAVGTDWALGIAARSMAQLGGEGAEERYLASIQHLDRAGVRLDVARAQLLYGEWLRRAGRPDDARPHLRSAHQALLAMGVGAFAQRAGEELAATGETVRGTVPDSPVQLTAQELHIARLAAQGRTNSEIGAELYLSRHTVDWHLRKVFSKLGISSRREIPSKLPLRASTA